MKKLYLMNTGWRFSKEVRNGAAGGDDDFNMFTGYTKTGTMVGPGSDGCSDRSWQEVNLPHDWVVAEDYDKDGVQGFKPRGAGWYRKWFEAKKEWLGKRLYLHFEGISGHSQVILNNICIAKSESSYTPIYVEVTDLLHYGQPNLLAVRCDNQQGEGWWYDGCGIYRDVWLEVKEYASFAHDGVFVWADRGEGDQWQLHVRAEVENAAPDMTVTVECMDETATAPADGSVITVTVEDPPLWYLDAPELEDVTVTLCHGDDVLDEQVIPFGFRTVSFDVKNGCVLNGEPVKLKGVCMHHDHAGVGVAIPYELHLYRLQMLKEMGCNAIRTSHNPQSPGFYRACDQLGFAVMDETRHFGSAPEELHQLRTMVRRDRNHPCVFFWSLFNEEPLQCSVMGERIARTMKKVVDTEDGTRPVSGGMNGPLECEGAVNVVDMMGFNYLQYGYDEFHAAYPEMPIVGSETSSYLSQRGETKNFINDTELRRSAFGKVRSLTGEGAPNMYAWADDPGVTWKRIVERPYVAGGFAWTGMDYRGEAVWPNVTADFGAMDLCGFPKDAYYWYQSMWLDNQLQAVRYDDPADPEKGLLMCYTDGDTVYIKEHGKIRSYPNDPFDPKPIPVSKSSELRVAATKNGKKVAAQALHKVGKADLLTVECGSEQARSGEATVFNVYLTDENGEMCDVPEKVVFTAQGGTVLGVGNGDTCSHAKENTNETTLYHGCCQAVVRADGNGPLTVKAVCGSFSDEYTVDVRPAEYESVPACEPWLRICPWRMSDIHTEYPRPEQIHDLMYNWIPTMAGVPKSLMMSGKQGYACFAGMFTAPDEPGEIHLKNVAGNFDLYLAGAKILSSGDELPHDYTVEIPEHQRGKRLGVSLVFRCTGGMVRVGDTYVMTK